MNPSVGLTLIAFQISRLIEAGMDIAGIADYERKRKFELALSTTSWKIYTRNYSCAEKPMIQWIQNHKYAGWNFTFCESRHRYHGIVVPNIFCSVLNSRRSKHVMLKRWRGSIIYFLLGWLMDLKDGVSGREKTGTTS